MRGPWYFEKKWLLLLCVGAAGALIYFFGGKITAFLNFIFYYPLIMPTHEAGHAIICKFACAAGGCEPYSATAARVICSYAGTFFQHFWPCVFYVYFLRSSQPKAADFCLLWLGVSFTDARSYIADARALDLVLINQAESGIGEIHDWRQILYSLDLLKHDILIANIYYAIGCGLVALAVYCLLYHIKHNKHVNFL